MTGFRNEQTYIIDTPMPKDRVVYVCERYLAVNLGSRWTNKVPIDVIPYPQPFE